MHGMDDSMVASKLQAVAAELEAGCREHPNESEGTLPADDFVKLVAGLTEGALTNFQIAKVTLAAGAGVDGTSVDYLSVVNELEALAAAAYTAPFLRPQTKPVAEIHGNSGIDCAQEAPQDDSRPPEEPASEQTLCPQWRDSDLSEFQPRHPSIGNEQHGLRLASNETPAISSPTAVDTSMRSKLATAAATHVYRSESAASDKPLTRARKSSPSTASKLSVSSMDAKLAVARSSDPTKVKKPKQLHKSLWTKYKEQQKNVAVDAARAAAKERRRVRSAAKNRLSDEFVQRNQEAEKRWRKRTGKRKPGSATRLQRDVSQAARVRSPDVSAAIHAQSSSEIDGPFLPTSVAATREPLPLQIETAADAGVDIDNVSALSGAADEYSDDDDFEEESVFDDLEAMEMLRMWSPPEQRDQRWLRLLEDYGTDELAAALFEEFRRDTMPSASAGGIARAALRETKIGQLLAARWPSLFAENLPALTWEVWLSELQRVSRTFSAQQDETERQIKEHVTASKRDPERCLRVWIVDLVWAGTDFDPMTVPPRDVYRRLWADVKNKTCVDNALSTATPEHQQGEETALTVPPQGCHGIRWKTTLTGLPCDVVKRLADTDVEMRAERIRLQSALIKGIGQPVADAAESSRSTELLYGPLTCADALSETAAEMIADDAAEGKDKATQFLGDQMVPVYLRQRPLISKAALPRLHFEIEYGGFGRWASVAAGPDWLVEQVLKIACAAFELPNHFDAVGIGAQADRFQLTLHSRPHGALLLPRQSVAQAGLLDGTRLLLRPAPRRLQKKSSDLFDRDEERRLQALAARRAARRAAAETQSAQWAADAAAVAAAQAARERVRAAVPETMKEWSRRDTTTEQTHGQGGASRYKVAIFAGEESHSLSSCRAFSSKKLRGAAFHNPLVSRVNSERERREDMARDRALFAVC
eukprot:SAG31_NODE_736_length_12477_cov_60.959363_7_plen_932_part_00